MSIKHISGVINLANNTSQQFIGGFPDKYALLHVYFHSPSVNLYTVQSEGIALQVSDSVDSIYDDLFIESGVPAGVSMPEPNSGYFPSISETNSASNTTRVLQGDLSVTVNPPANAPATVQVEFVVLDLSE